MNEIKISDLSDQQLQQAYINALESFFVMHSQTNQQETVTNALQQEILSRRERQNSQIMAKIPKLKKLELPTMKPKEQ